MEKCPDSKEDDVGDRVRICRSLLEYNPLSRFFAWDLGLLGLGNELPRISKLLCIPGECLRGLPAVAPENNEPGEKERDRNAVNKGRVQRNIQIPGDHNVLESW